MPAHLRPPERQMAHPIGALVAAVVISLIVVAAFSSRPSEEEGTTPRLIQPATETSEVEVLGEVIENTTAPDAPPASAVGFTTTTEEPSGSRTFSPGTTPPTAPGPTLGPPVSITNPSPPTTVSTTTTTEPAPPPPPTCDTTTSTTSTTTCVPPG